MKVAYEPLSVVPHKCVNELSLQPRIKTVSQIPKDNANISIIPKKQIAPKRRLSIF